MFPIRTSSPCKCGTSQEEVTRPKFISAQIVCFYHSLSKSGEYAEVGSMPLFLNKLVVTASGVDAIRPVIAFT